MNKKVLQFLLYGILIISILYTVATKFLIFNKNETLEIDSYKKYITTMSNHDFKDFTYRFENDENNFELIKKISKIENINYIKYENKNKIDLYNSIYNKFLNENKEMLKTQGLNGFYFKETLEKININLDNLEKEFDRELEKK